MAPSSRWTWQDLVMMRRSSASMTSCFSSLSDSTSSGVTAPTPRPGGEPSGEEPNAVRGYTPFLPDSNINYGCCVLLRLTTKIKLSKCKNLWSYGQSKLITNRTSSINFCSSTMLACFKLKPDQYGQDVTDTDKSKFHELNVKKVSDKK